MPRSQKPRKRYRPRIVTVNTVETAVAGAGALDSNEVLIKSAIIDNALNQFQKGIDCAHHWATLADAINMAEALIELRIGAGQQPVSIVKAAHQVMQDVAHQHASTQSWTLRAPQLATLADLAWLHKFQLGQCSRGEFTRAFNTVTNRVSQALAGAPMRKATVVIAGGIGKPAAQPQQEQTTS